MTSHRSPSGHFGIFGVGMIAFFAGSFFILPASFATTYSNGMTAMPFIPQETEEEQHVRPTAAHIPTPEYVRGIYMSQCVVGTPSFRDSLVQLIDETDLNSVVIDIKDYTGYIAFQTDNPLLKDAVSDDCGARDMESFIKTLHAKNIYIIGRITVFQDPRYTALYPEESVQSISRPGEPWEDYKGLSFVSVSSRAFHDYIIELSKESYAIGFDELNYDYIRWPSDGPLKDVDYPGTNRAEEVEKFWRYLREQMNDTGAVLSADLFGYASVLTDDLGIGQQLERALPYFDYVMPMVYPSHYNKGFAGLANPNSDPYKVVYTSMIEAVRRTVSTESSVKTIDGETIFKTEIVPATINPETGETIATSTKQVPSGLYTKESYSKLKMRPWLQDFDYGKDYTPADIQGQIQATYDAGLTSWIFWDPGNKYSALRQVLKNDTTTQVSQ